MADNKTLEERYAAEKLTDNAALDPYKQCKDCFFRDKTAVRGMECGWQKGNCKIYEYPHFKPNDVMRNRAECEYYEKQKD